MVNMILVLCQVHKRRKALSYSDLVSGISIPIMNNVRGVPFCATVNLDVENKIVHLIKAT